MCFHGYAEVPKSEIFQHSFQNTVGEMGSWKPLVIHLIFLQYNISQFNLIHFTQLNFKQKLFNAMFIIINAWQSQ